MSDDRNPDWRPNRFTRGDRPVTTGETVTVACKLPHGIVLRVFDWEEFDEPMRDGSLKRSRRAIPIEAMEFTVRGTWTASAGQAYAKNNAAVQDLLPGGYALTHGVPKQTWDLWYQQNRNEALVKNKIVFAYSSHQTVTEEAQKLRAVKSGMEPLDPQKPAERLPGGVDRRLRLGILETGEGTAPR
jgi:hypothetical protein